MDPDSDILLRILKEQLKASQQGNIENSKVLSSLNRNSADIGPWKTTINPTPEIGPWKTTTTPGDAGRFANPMFSMPQQGATLDDKLMSPSGQQSAQAIRYLDKNIDYTPGPRESTNVEDNRQTEQNLAEHDALPWTKENSLLMNIPDILKALLGGSR